jgi:hypothetical protein
MIELLLISNLFLKLSKLAEMKNRSRWFPWLLPILWIGLELLFARLAYTANRGDPNFSDLGTYGFALLGGFLGAGIAFGLVFFLPQKLLKCPECEWEFTEHGPIGVECKQCGTWLRVTSGKVYRI